MTIQEFFKIRRINKLRRELGRIATRLHTSEKWLLEEFETHINEWEKANYILAQLKDLLESNKNNNDIPTPKI